MLNFYKNLKVIILVITFAIGIISPLTVLAATSPSLGAADSYSILSGAGITNGGAGTTTISGDLGGSSYTDDGITVFTIPGNPHDSAFSASALAAQLAVYNGPSNGIDSTSQPCTVTYVANDTELSTVGPLDPGVYCSPRDFLLSGTVTLNGTGDPTTDVWIFRAERDMVGTATANIIFSGTGGYACNVWWRVANDATFTENLAIVGNILAHNSVTFGQSTTLNGRAFAYVAAVTMLGNTISGPTCVAAAPGTLRIIKNVINDNNGTSTASAFNLHVKLLGSEVVGSPAVGVVSPGTSYSLTAATYVVSEVGVSGYNATFSGDCDANGNVTVVSGVAKTCTITNNDVVPQVTGQNYTTVNVVKTVINDNGGTKVVADFPLFVNGVLVQSGDSNSFADPYGGFVVTETQDPNYVGTFSGDCDASGRQTSSGNSQMFCILTNNDIGASVVVPPVPPLIDVVKVPSPLALPAGPGAVTYTYTVHNIGTVPMTDVTLVGDSCSPIVLISGDTNADNKLNVSETWVHTCSTILTQTHTNTVVATGWANGISATDIASALVVVGVPLVPPLIHITKIPNPLTLRAGGGMVTYTKTVTNPGTVPLSNVKISDDKCSPVKYISGDTNNDAKLDPTETWKYTCLAKLTKTTLNTAYVTGEANGLTARDFALATVVVATFVPKLPNTGFNFGTGSISGTIMLILVIGLFISTILIVALKKSRI